MSEPRAERAGLAVVRETLDAAQARVRSWMSTLSTPAKVMVLGTALTALALAAWLGVRVASEPYTVLFSRLEGDDAAAVVAKLKESKVPYRLTGDGGVIEVPEVRVHELRLELASAGLPRGGGVGFEVFDKMRLGATEFEQRVTYRRALEGELSRTIGTVASVQSARVHIVLPERSVFVARREAASASIVVRLRKGRAMGASEVAGIVHLVASAVPGLAADHVTLVTTEGAMLHRPRGGPDEDRGGLDAAETPPSRALEASVEERIRAMLDRALGAGHADVRVSAEVDSARIERTEDRYDPSKKAVRSEESTVERTVADDSVAGVPGAESNLPSGAGPDPAEAKPPSNVTRESKTRNYEIDHVMEKRTSTSGVVKRLTVAVVVDAGSAGAGQAEIAKITQLVKSAAGFDEKRGDIVTVESLPFPKDVELPPAPEGAVVKVIRENPKAAAAGVVAAVLLVGVALLALMRRSRVRAASASRGPSEAGDLEAVQLPGGGTTPLLSEPAEPAPDLREAALELAARDPATAALVIREWLGASLAEKKGDEAALWVQPLLTGTGCSPGPRRRCCFCSRCPRMPRLRSSRSSVMRS